VKAEAYAVDAEFILLTLKLFNSRDGCCYAIYMCVCEAAHSAMPYSSSLQNTSYCFRFVLSLYISLGVRLKILLFFFSCKEMELEREFQ